MTVNNLKKIQCNTASILERFISVIIFKLCVFSYHFTYLSIVFLIINGQSVVMFY